MADGNLEFVDPNEPTDKPDSFFCTLGAPQKKGKTFSALELATGLGGSIALVNTEPGRGRIYKGNFDYRLLDFDPPYSTARFHKVIDLIERHEIRNAVIDSASDQWQGPGGILHAHHTECERLIKSWSPERGPKKKHGEVSPAAWAKIKPEERQMWDRMLRCGANIILTVRMERKTAIVKETDRNGKPKTVFKDLGDQMVCSTKLPFLSHVNIVVTGEGNFKVAEGENFLEPLKPIFARHKRLSRELGADIGAFLAGNPGVMKPKPGRNAPKPQPEAPDEPNFDDLETDSMVGKKELLAQAETVYREAEAAQDGAQLSKWIRSQPEAQQVVLREWLKVRKNQTTPASDDPQESVPIL